MQSVKMLAQEALALSPIDRLLLVEAVLKSLDKPDPTIDEIWVEEAEKRYIAYKEGRLKSISWETIKERF